MHCKPSSLCDVASKVLTLYLSVHRLESYKELPAQAQQLVSGTSENCRRLATSKTESQSQSLSQSIYATVLTIRSYHIVASAEFKNLNWTDQSSPGSRLKFGIAESVVMTTHRCYHMSKNLLSGVRAALRRESMRMYPTCPMTRNDTVLDICIDDSQYRTVLKRLRTQCYLWI